MDSANLETVRAGTDSPAPKADVNALVALCAADMADVNALILERMQSDVPTIPALAEHLISAGGKRLRPLLCVAAARLCGTDNAHHHNLSAAVEFIHTATLLHDDVVDSSSLRRTLNFLSFFASALCYCLFRGGRYDLAYVYHPPITVGLAAAIGGGLRRLPFVLEVQDLWPDTLAATGMSGAARLAPPLGALCRIVYARARSIIVQSEGMRRALVGR